MTKFTFESHHELNYGWEVQAPEGLSQDTLEELINDFINYTDAYTQENLDTFLLIEELINDFINYTDAYTQENLDTFLLISDIIYPPELLVLYKQVKIIRLEENHGDSYTQSWNKF